MKTEELNQAIAAFLICFGQTMPKELVRRVQENTNKMANQMLANGETNVAKLTKGLGDALGEFHASN